MNLAATLSYLHLQREFARRDADDFLETVTEQVVGPWCHQFLEPLPAYPVLPVDDTHDVETRGDVVVLRFRQEGEVQR